MLEEVKKWNNSFLHFFQCAGFFFCTSGAINSRVARSFVFLLLLQTAICVGGRDSVSCLQQEEEEEEEGGGGGEEYRKWFQQGLRQMGLGDGWKKSSANKYV